MREYLLLLLIVSGACVLSLLLWSWRQRQELIERYPKNAQFPLGELPSKSVRALELMLQIVLWSMLSCAWLAAWQHTEDTRAVTVQLPQAIGQSVPIKQLTFFVDTSRSMTVLDSREGQARLDRAKEIIDSVVARTEGVNTALFGFTNHPFQLVPSTPDRFFLRLIARNLRVNESGSGTNLVNLLMELKDRYGEKSRKLATATLVVLISDGGDTDWEQLSGEEHKQKEEVLQQLFEGIRQYPIKVMTVGLGSKQGGVVPGMTFQGQQVRSKLEEPLMKLIGSMGRGGYLNANALSAEAAGNEILKVLDQMGPEQSEWKASREVIRAENSLWRVPLGLALIALLVLILYPMAKRGIEQKL